MSDDSPTSADSFAGLQGNEMDEDEARSFLEAQGFGALSLADGDDAYGVPLSFGYDGEALYFVLLRPGEESKKERFVRSTDTASFLVYDVGGKFDWRSVIVSGSLEELADDEWETARDALDENAWFPSLFSETEPMRDILGFKLVVSDVSGQQSGGAE